MSSLTWFTIDAEPTKLLAWNGADGWLSYTRNADGTLIKQWAFNDTYANYDSPEAFATDYLIRGN